MAYCGATKQDVDLALCFGLNIKFCEVVVESMRVALLDPKENECLCVTR